MTEAASKQEITLERILLHELIHRINNEFSSLIGAVSRTAARSVNHEVKVALAHIIELLSHYAELHRALQMPERDTQIDAAAYLEDLCLSISRSKLDGMKIALVLTASPLWLPSERCWRLGMMVYELVTNAARHAFGNGKGEIRVELSRAGKLVLDPVRRVFAAQPFLEPFGKVVISAPVDRDWGVVGAALLSRERRG